MSCRVMRSCGSYFVHGLIGLLEGGLFCVLPSPVDFAWFLALLILWTVAFLRSESRLEQHGHGFKIAVWLLLVAGMILLLPRHLDIRVGPMAYTPLPLSQLAPRLFADWGIRVTPLGGEVGAIFVALKTETRMSRRQVLEQLARDTNTELIIWNCGFCSNFVFPSYPAFIYLGARNESCRPTHCTRPRQSEPMAEYRSWNGGASTDALCRVRGRR